MITNRSFVYIITMKKQRGKTARNIFLVLGCLLVLVLNSCGQSITKLDTTATPLPATALTSIFPPSPTAVLISTPQSLPTPEYILDYPYQVTDGILLLSVERVRDKCYKSLEPIVLKFIFRNLTDKAIDIPDDLSIAFNRWGNGGALSPFITSAEGLDIYSSLDTVFADSFPDSPTSYITILGNHEFEKYLVYGFPDYIVPPPQENPNGEAITPSPGQYFIRFHYFWDKHRQETDNTWHGSIDSNRIEICVIN